MYNEAILNLLPNNPELKHYFWKYITEKWPQINHTTKIVMTSGHDYIFEKIIGDNRLQTTPVGRWEKVKGVRGLLRRQLGGLFNNRKLERTGWRYVEDPPPSMSSKIYWEKVPLLRIGCDYFDYERVDPYQTYAMRCGYHPMTDTFIVSRTRDE